MKLIIRPRNKELLDISENGILTFFAPDAGGYIRLCTERKPGILGDQICDYGRFRGNTLSCNDEYSFKILCRRWARDYIQQCKKY